MVTTNSMLFSSTASFHLYAISAVVPFVVIEIVLLGKISLAILQILDNSGWRVGSPPRRASVPKSFLNFESNHKSAFICSIDFGLFVDGTSEQKWLQWAHFKLHLSIIW